MNYMLPAVIGIVLTLEIALYKFCSVPIFFAVCSASIMLIIITFRHENRRKELTKFDGYVCEICGKGYNCCCHSKDEDYTLVKRV